MKKQSTSSDILIGVGLRHNHYEDALTRPKAIDFIEVHAENFFAEGGAAKAVLDQVAKQYAISLHATTLGLGSARGIPKQPLQKLRQLIEQSQPLLVSDHVCFTWSSLQQNSNNEELFSPVHAGDLLPIAFNAETLDITVENVESVQQHIARQLLVENLSAYITPEGSTMSEVSFLTELCLRANCRLLLDINNLVVNASNANSADILGDVSNYIQQIPPQLVGEIHLAGCSPAQPGAPMIDDHSQPVPDIVWEGYRIALKHFGAIPTLVEWDTALPSWEVLTDEATKARAIAEEVLSRDVA